MKTAQKEKWNNFKERHPKIKKVADKISQLFEKYPNLRQLILFTLFSIVCFVIEYASYTILSFAIPNREPIKWFIFDFTTTASKGVAGFVAFLVSNVLAQASTFLINSISSVLHRKGYSIGIFYAFFIFLTLDHNAYHRLCTAFSQKNSSFITKLF